MVGGPWLFFTLSWRIDGGGVLDFFYFNLGY